jgi:hypothetical protein
MNKLKTIATWILLIPQLKNLPFRGIGMCLWCCWKDLDEQDLMKFIW